ncbi:MAG: hypothetical protein ABSD38_35635 [Syntrophorhabdales bacterium]|jgi:hypothetical protein
MKNQGYYTGALKLKEPWYRRRMRHGDLTEKGQGEYWYDYQGFYFLHEKTHRGLVIPMKSIIEVKIAFRHGITFSRRKILNIVWKNGAEKISSGFIVEDPELIKQALTTTGWA